MQVGRIASLYRYPVKSMAGESLDATPLGDAGRPGDRAWYRLALADARLGTEGRAGLALERALEAFIARIEESEVPVPQAGVKVEELA